MNLAIRVVWQWQCQLSIVYGSFVWGRYPLDLLIWRFVICGDIYPFSAVFFTRPTDIYPTICIDLIMRSTDKVTCKSQLDTTVTCLRLPHLPNQSNIILNIELRNSITSTFDMKWHYTFNTQLIDFISCCESNICLAFWKYLWWLTCRFVTTISVPWTISYQKLNWRRKYLLEAIAIV